MHDFVVAGTAAREKFLKFTFQTPNCALSSFIIYLLVISLIIEDQFSLLKNQLKITIGLIQLLSFFGFANSVFQFHNSCRRVQHIYESLKQKRLLSLLYSLHDFNIMIQRPVNLFIRRDIKAIVLRRLPSKFSIKYNLEQIKEGIKLK
jgi:hypothetical protein